MRTEPGGTADHKAVGPWVSESSLAWAASNMIRKMILTSVMIILLSANFFYLLLLHYSDYLFIVSLVLKDGRTVTWDLPRSINAQPRLSSFPCNLCFKKPFNWSALMTFIFNDMNVCTSVYEYVRVCVGAQAGQKTVSCSLELKLQAIVNCPSWMLGMELRIAPSLILFALFNFPCIYWPRSISGYDQYIMLKCRLVKVKF